MRNCCFNCFDFGCVHYCDTSVQFASVAPVAGVWTLELYWGDSYVGHVTSDLAAGDPLAFNLGVLNSDIATNLVLVAPNGTRQVLIDGDGNSYDCVQVRSLNAPSVVSLQIPLAIMP